MVPFKQSILPGDVGSDVLAVKNTMRRLGIKGSGAMNMGGRAGPAFVAALKLTQRHFEVQMDGKYGQETHGVVATHFDAADQALYQQAAIRKRPQPPAPSGDAAAAAKQLLALQAQGKYHADNAADLGDIHATAAGQAVHSQSGQMIHIDARVFQVLIHLIGLGHKIGTFAICSDHHFDSPTGHSGGRAVDISSIDGVAVAAPASSSKALVLKIDNALHAAGPLKPRQLITGGCGNARDAEISALSIPAADSFFGPDTMQDHCNHIHVGY